MGSHRALARPLVARYAQDRSLLTRALRALVGVGLSLDPEGRKRKAGAHRLPAFGFFISKKCFNQESIHLKKKTDHLKNVFF